MPTNEERREVARKLREKQSERNRPDVFVPQSMGVMAEILYEDLISCVPNRGNIFLALADLIEPEPERTCHIAHGKCFHPQDEDRCLDKDNDFFGFDYWQDCEFYGCRRSKAGCSECGAVFTGGYLAKNNYCQNCGAKITNDRSDT